MADTGGPIRDLEDRLSILTSPAAAAVAAGEPESSMMAAGNDVTADVPMVLKSSNETQHYMEKYEDKEDLSPSASSTSSSSSPHSNTTTTTNSNPRRSNDRTRLKSIARTAVRVTKEQFWDSNEPGIVVAQTAVDRWEEIYMWCRNVVVTSSRSVAGIYDASKAGARGLDRGFLVPLRDYVLLPTFGVAEHIVGETSSFVQSPEAETIRRIAAEGSSEFVANTVPFGLGETVVLPAVRLGSETVQTAWNVARYPVPSQKNVRDTVDFLLNGSKKNLSVCGSEIVWYFRRADANIARTLRRTQWVVLGSGPYETLDVAGRQDIMDHVCERYLSIGKGGDGDGDDGSENNNNDSTTVMVARYEFMANVRACNRSLYRDLVETGMLKERGGASTIDDEWLSERPRYRSRSSDLYLLGDDDEEEDEHAAAGDKNDCTTVFALWFRLPFENGKRPKKDVPWIHFDPKDGELLEEKYRSILKQQSNSNTTPGESSTPTAAAATTSREEGHLTEEGLPQQEKSPQTKPTTQIWESPKYATNAKWYNPDLDRDVLLDQKRHAVTFVRCSPDYHKEQEQKQQQQQYDEGERDVIAQQQPTSEGHHECLRSQEKRQIFDEEEEDQIFHHQLLWEAECLFALPPPLLGLYRPTMWRSYGPDEIRRAVWFLDTPRNGPQPYGEDAQALLEDAYQFLKWKIGLNQRVKHSKSSAEDTSSITSDDSEKCRDDNGNENVLLTVQVSSPDSSEQQLVQFTSLTVATAIGKGLGGALSLFKRRVYRGAYNYIAQDENDDFARNKKCVEEDVPTQMDEDSGWTTTTEDALEKLSLTFSTKDSIITSEESEENINIEYKECFKNSDQEQVFEEATKPSLNQNECPSSTNFEYHPYDDGPSLAFRLVSTRKNLANIVDDGPEVDHLILVVHGIGEMMQAFDLFGLKKVPTLADCCGYLRDNHAEISDARFAKLSQTKTNRMKETNKSGRVEYLPIEWHEAFSIQSTRRPLGEPESSRSNQSSSKVSVDDISLRTIPTLRSFANDTLMDILYFMSPAHHDIMIDIVSFELNFIVKRFRKLTGFKGDISIIGHSIGSVIAWDILDHQQNAGLSTRSSMGQEDCTLTKADDLYRYPQLHFKVDSVYLLGSPIPVFLMIRNQEKPLTKTFTLNGCCRVFNIFHPYDPVSYRIEPLIDPRNSEIEPDIMIHWNGGFRFQYQTKRIWKKIVDQTLRAEENVIHSLESGIEALGLVDSTFTKSVAHENDTGISNDHDVSHLLITGALNGGRRIDYMLQEKEIDRANEYVAALAAHSCYWLEKDLSLFIANEICIEKERKQGGNNIL